MAEGNLKTKLAQLIFVDEENAKAALASLGYAPKESVMVPQDVDTDEIEAAARAAGVEEGKETAMAGVKEVMEKCVLGKVSDPAFIKELVALSPDEAGTKIMEAQASGSPVINSHRNPMNDGGINPTIEACKRLSKEV